MKKLMIIAGIAAMTLTACSNEELVNPGTSHKGAAVEAPMAFNVGTRNMGRGTTALNLEYTDFGVWAIKTKVGVTVADAAATGATNLVMDNYKVVYDATNPDAQFGAVWYYAGVTGKAEQYLKYWDMSYAQTHFFAYAPYNAAYTFNDGGNAKLVFGTVYNTKTPAGAPIYATTVEDNINYALNYETGTQNGNHLEIPGGVNTNVTKKVPLTFHRLYSQIELAVWEDIPGYTITLDNVSFTAEDNNNFAPVNGIALIPAKKELGAWVKGECVAAACPVIDFSGITPAVSYTDVESYSATIDFAIPAGQIGETCEDRSASADKWYVVPTTGVTATAASATHQTTNDGFQVVMNYTLKAVDTNETIVVKNARVYVAPEYVKWAPNTKYTYIFRITRNTSGNTNGTEPTNAPEEPELALYPIVFDNVQVTEYVDGAVVNEWVVNPSEVSGGDDSVNDTTHTPVNAN